MTAIKQETKKDIHRCIDCRHAELHRWDHNPVIARCRALSTLPRQVAGSLIRCQMFEQRSASAPVKIIQHTHLNH